MAITLHPSFAVHPGEWLKTEIVELYGLNVTVAAAKLGVTRNLTRDSFWVIGPCGNREHPAQGAA